MAACERDETAGANHHRQGLCRAVVRHCRDEVARRYRDEAARRCRNPDEAADHRNPCAVDDRHRVVCCHRNPGAAACHQNRDAEDDRLSAPYLRSPYAEDDPKSPCAEACRRNPVSLAACCPAVSYPATYSQNPGAGDDRQTA